MKEVHTKSLIIKLVFFSIPWFKTINSRSSLFIKNEFGIEQADGSGRTIPVVRKT